ncbi:unnamed protein product [Caenorhabditis sp. 36 PRJEB53466]|nr:unnamed protein product [Caenorhabditis sp. 36 PRJEB53466]
MVDGGEEEENDQNVRYWKTKYELLYADYGRTKDRSEDLETRLLEVVEENERREGEKQERIQELETEIGEANRRIEQLEAACFRYKNHGKLTKTEAECEIAQNVETNSDESTPCPTDGITRSPDFHAGQHLICEYHKLPVLAKGEGFIYGFRWNETNKIHIV